MDCASICMDKSLRRAVIGDGGDSALVGLMRALEQLTVQQALTYIQDQATATATATASLNSNPTAEGVGDVAVRLLSLLAAEIEQGGGVGFSWADIRHAAPSGDRLVLLTPGGDFEFEVLLGAGSGAGCDAAFMLAPSGVIAGINCLALPAHLLAEELSKSAVGGSGRSLSDIRVAVGASLAKYASYTEALGDIDAHMWVVEPAGLATGASQSSDPPCDQLTPCFLHTPVRRCVLDVERGVSVSLALDPVRPRQAPPLHLHGPPAATERFQGMLASNLHLWDETLLPRENIARVMSASVDTPQALPTRTQQRKQAETQLQEQGDSRLLCGICYSYQLSRGGGDGPPGSGGSGGSGGSVGSAARPVPGEVPAETCGNPKCAKKFHKWCLFNWLVSLPTTKRSFGLLFGKCPFCTEPLNIRVTR